MTNSTAPAATSRMFGRCGMKGCRTRVVADLTGVRTHFARNGGAAQVMCVEHRTGLLFGGIKGTLTGDPCGPRCWNAKTGTCKCSCGGAEHGSRA